MHLLFKGPLEMFRLTYFTLLTITMATVVRFKLRTPFKGEILCGRAGLFVTLLNGKDCANAIAAYELPK